MKNVRYINAGAGSGKTYRLTEILKGALTDENVKPSEVILTTFTELAAAEFKEKACSALLDGDCDDEERRRRINISAELGSAMIGTLHSVAFSFIKKYWYKLNMGADINIMSDVNKNVYVGRSLANALTDEHYSSINEFYACFNLSDEHNVQPYWRKMLASIVEKMDYYNVDDISVSRKMSIESIENVMCGRAWNDGEKKICDGIIDKYIEFLKNKGTGISIENARKLEGSRNYDVCYGSMLNVCDVFDKTLKAFLNSINEDEKVMIGNFEDYLNSVSYRKTMLDFTNALFDIAQKWHDDFKRYKKLNHLVDFNDLELIFFDMLKNDEDVRNEIKSNYKILMVDEFQDSNPIQVKIFNEISELIAENGGRSVWVGDPKQTIYSFRGSDNELVTSIARMFEGNMDNGLSSEILSKSWRSRRPLVELVNNVFEKVFTRDEFPNRKLISLNHNYENDLDGDAVIHWNFQSKRRTAPYDAFAMKVKELAESGVKVKNKQRDNERPISYGDIAILTRENRNANNISKCLRNLGLPVSSPENNILQRKEIQLVKTILLYIVNPYSASLRADMACMVEGMTTEQVINDRMHYLNDNKEDKYGWRENEGFVKIADDLRRRVEKMSVKDIVKAVINELNIVNIAARWNEADTRRQNLYTLASMAEKYEEDCLVMGAGATITGFVNYMQTANADTASDNASDTIKVLTYHKSKGLEWPVVILTSLDDDCCDVNFLIKKNFMGVNEFSMKSEGRDIMDRSYYIHFFPQIISERRNVKDVLQEKIKADDAYKTMNAKILSESKRLMYVGMTRARDYLVSVTYGDKQPKWLQNIGIDSEITPNDGKAAIWGEGCEMAKYEECSADVAGIDNDVASVYDCIAKPYERECREDKFVSPSKIVCNDVKAEMRMEDGVGKGISRQKWNDMAAVGTCIHNIFAAYKKGSELNGEMADRVIKRNGLEKELGACRDDILQSADALYDYLSKTYGESTGIDREMPFYHVRDGQMVNGEIDMAWNYVKDGRKCCVLVDYKSFPGRAKDLKEHTEGYIPQLKAYKSALEAAGRIVTDCIIFYAVQGTVVSVKV